MAALVKFLSQPPPIIAALVNAGLGLLLAMLAPIAFFALELAIVGFRTPAFRLLLYPGPVQFLFVGSLGAIAGLVSVTVLLWAAPRRKDAVQNALFPVTAVFTICTMMALAVCQLHVHQQTGISIVIFAFSGCGVAMALVLASAARRLGAQPQFVPWSVASLGGCLAGAAMAMTLALRHIGPLELLPALWLGFVTYFCLKPLPQRQKTGL